MIIWTRLGILVPVITLAGLIITQLLIEFISGDSAYYQAHQWPLLLGAAITGSAIWLLGRKLNRDATKLLLDPETGKEVWIDRKHTFFFVPMQYWGIVLCVAAIAAALIEQAPA